MITPVPVPAVVLLKGAGSNGLHNVWLPAISPAVTPLGVNVKQLLFAEQAIPLTVEVVTLRKLVIADTDGAS